MSTNLKTLELKRYLALVIFILTLSQGLFAQNFKKMFKYIEEGDIGKAAIENYKFSSGSAVKNSEEDMLLGISNCIILMNENYDNYDPYKSLETFELLSKINADKTDVDKFLAKYNLGLDKVNYSIYQNILNEAKNKNTEASYQKALDVCQDCFYMDEVIKLKETSAFNEAKVKMSIEGYKYFLSTYPLSEYSNEIKSLLELVAFQDAKSQASVKSMNDYIKEYSRSENLYISIAEHIRDSIIEDKKIEYQAMLEMKPAKLKEVLLHGGDDGGDLKNSNQRNNNFPLRYYDGNQIFYTVRFGTGNSLKLCVINDNLEETILKHENGGSIILIGESNRKEEFFHSTQYLVPSIGSKIFHDIGTAESSYNKKKFLMTITYDYFFGSYGTYSDRQDVNIISYDAIFKETNNTSGEYVYCSRLSNNNILIVFKVKLEYLSHQLSSAFGIDGYGKLSRTISSSDYYKFLVISEDGSKIVSNKNYIFPFKTIKPIDGGFAIFSNKLSNVITLNEDDFGKEIILKNEFGQDIIIKENLSFSSGNNYKEGVKIFKFDNSANLIKELIIDNPSDDNIKTPIALNLQHGEDYICVQYYSFDEEIVNRRTGVFKLFDFNLNLISKVTFSAQNKMDDWYHPPLFSKGNTFYWKPYEKGIERIVFF